MSEIIVGVDGSARSLSAVEWAAEEAARRNASLRIVYAMAPWLFDAPVGEQAQTVREWMLGGGQEVIAEAAQRAEARAPRVRVSAQTVRGGPAKALLEAASGAAMVVVGSSGAGELTGLLTGSVALQVVAHARCPAVAIRELEATAHREVVVGVDGSPTSREAIGRAFEAAALRGARLRAVLAWRHPALAYPSVPIPPQEPFEWGETVDDEEVTLAESLTGWPERYPDVQVEREVVSGRPTRVLSGASARADLLVVGARGLGGFAGLVLGSVSHAMLHHAQCPIMVVPARPQ